MDTGTLRELAPFTAELEVEIEAASPERVEARMPWAPERCTAGGVLHGGALMAFADTAGAVMASLHLPPGAATTTIESKTNFFRPVSSGMVHATTRALHVGRRTIVVQTDLTRDDGKPVAQVTQTQAVITDA
jgi:1,4-dihydroxy-2-naphthoyl-CoA hydrolase